MDFQVHPSPLTLPFYEAEEVHYDTQPRLTQNDYETLEGEAEAKKEDRDQDNKSDAEKVENSARTSIIIISMALPMVTDSIYPSYAKS
mmetsp:Transcript_635/g.729  ORF Transcript_635/g.729 Transcript_635/m.729 type:complete len:88 (+) Transcript_635:59-322(+)